MLTAVTSDGSSTTITGTLTSAPDTSFMVEFYGNDACNPSGYGEGQTFLGAAAVTTDDSGATTFVVTLDGSESAGQYVSATATDPAGNTSAFAACWQLPATTLPSAAALRTAVPAAPLRETTLPAPPPTAAGPAEARFGTLRAEAARAAGAAARAASPRPQGRACGRPTRWTSPTRPPTAGALPKGLISSRTPFPASSAAPRRAGARPWPEGPNAIAHPGAPGNPFGERQAIISPLPLGRS